MVTQQPQLVSVIGGSGFVGTQLVQELARRGYRVRVGVRRPDLAGHLRTLGMVGQIQPMQVNVRNMPSVQAGVAGADIVINLCAIGVEGGRQRFRAVNTMGAANVAKAAKLAGATRFIHMSALGADIDASSAFLRSRALGEVEVKAAFPEAIILRPSVIFGPDDDFFNRFGTMARLFPVLPVVGAQTKFQPVYVGDVADALAAAADGDVATGKIYELGGPEIVTMRQIMEEVNAQALRSRPLINLPDGLANFIAFFTQILPNPMLTQDQVKSLSVDNVVSDEAGKQKRTLKAFNVSPTPMSQILPDYMWRFRKHGEFDKAEA